MVQQLTLWGRLFIAAAMALPFCAQCFGARYRMHREELSRIEARSGREIETSNPMEDPSRGRLAMAKQDAGCFTML